MAIAARPRARLLALLAAVAVVALAAALMPSSSAGFLTGSDLNRFRVTTRADRSAHSALNGSTLTLGQPVYVFLAVAGPTRSGLSSSSSTTHG